MKPNSKIRFLALPLAPVAKEEQWQQLKTWIVSQPDWEILFDDKYFIQAIVKIPPDEISRRRAVAE
ncbi:MAG: hypothetical protein LJE74_11615 [Proteobacteria bacterium]|nr:hypothetical protein [Pseudomonadota bacterium]MCG6934440.1 hypothetical protein [Pseudomonadota bacterium]